MRKSVVLAAVLGLALFLTGPTASAQQVTWKETATGGYSKWAYRDHADIGRPGSYFKTEGAYKAFDLGAGGTGRYKQYPVADSIVDTVGGEVLISWPFIREARPGVVKSADKIVLAPGGSASKALKAVLKRAPVVSGTLNVVGVPVNNGVPNSTWDPDLTAAIIAGPTVNSEGAVNFSVRITNTGASTMVLPKETGFEWRANYDYLYLPGPHGDYDTGSNKCKVCHTSHRAGGAFMLLRVDKPDDACSYCHVGDARHAEKRAYTHDGSANIYPRFGHTIGSGEYIPDSSVWQTTEQVVMQGGWDYEDIYTPGNKIGSSETITVRSYDDRRNKMFKIAVRGQDEVKIKRDNGSIADITTKAMRIYRVGPRYLWCMTCHQPHNSRMLTWRPINAGGGYKLLRNAPSGSVNDRNKMENYAASTRLIDVRPSADLVDGWQSAKTAGKTLGDYFIQVPDTVLSAATTGSGKTIYTKWNGPDVPIVAQSLSVWCADCHNLDIGTSPGSKVEFSGSFRGEERGSHPDRTHPVPMQLMGSLTSRVWRRARNGESFGGAAQEYGTQCYTCHRADMVLLSDRLDGLFPTDGGKNGYTQTQADVFNTNKTGELCARCHIDVKAYALWQNTPNRSDFPHSSPTPKFLPKLLAQYDADYNVISATTLKWTTTKVGGKTLTNITNLDAFCLTCHASNRFVGAGM